MATRALYWKTQNNSAKYVDSFIGNDVTGDGTMSKPYKTLVKAFQSVPGTIVCRGVFSEDMSTGRHAQHISGDYMGAAVFDGQDTYDLCGFSLSNMIVLNTPSTPPPTAWQGSNYNAGGALFAGVGRAGGAVGVGGAVAVGGVSGSSVILNGCKLYWGCIGGSTAVQRVVYANLKHNSTYKLCYQNQRGQDSVNCTVYNLDKADVRLNPDTADKQSFTKWLFARAAVVVNNQTKTSYRYCVFTSDCQFVYISGSTVTELTSEVLSEYAGDNLGEKITAYVTAQGATTLRIPVFENCVFSEQTAAQILNDPAHNDFTIVPGSDADFGNNSYAGAFPPAVRVPIHGVTSDGNGTTYGSDGHAACWDDRTVAGCVTTDDGQIVMDETSASTEGSILSKIISINPLERQINAIYSYHEPMMASGHCLMNDELTLDEEECYDVGDEVPAGIFYVSGADVLFSDEVSASKDTCIVLGTAGLTFAKFDAADVGTPRLVRVTEPNMQDVVYVRCRTSVYAMVKAADATLSNVVYLNTGLKSLTFRGRTIVPGESFYGHDGSYFTVADNDADYEVAVIFDDREGVPAYGSGEEGARLVPESDRWVPAQLMGAYFVAKTAAGAINSSSTNGYPYGSGNYLSWKETAGQQNRSYIDRVYSQFKFVVRRYSL